MNIRILFLFLCCANYLYAVDELVPPAKEFRSFKSRYLHAKSQGKLLHFLTLNSVMSSSDPVLRPKNALVLWGLVERKEYAHVQILVDLALDYRKNSLKNSEKKPHLCKELRALIQNLHDLQSFADTLLPKEHERWAIELLFHAAELQEPPAEPLSQETQDILDFILGEENYSWRGNGSSSPF